MSFKRRTPIGTKPPAGPPATSFSTGIPSLDDVLGNGGVPSGCIFVALTPDQHSSYGDLLQKYSIAQGLHANESICVFAEDARELVDTCMWIPVSQQPDVAMTEEDAKMTIAWRYENVKQFQTTVDANLFDLSTRIPQQLVADALHTGRLRLVPKFSFDRCLEVVREELSFANAAPLRVCLPALGGFQWGDVSPTTIMRFLYSLRGLLRGTSLRACSVTITLPPHMGDDSWAGLSWAEKLGWLSDACITLAAFSADPSMVALFPAYHGLMRIHSLPAPHSFVPMSDRTSILRGLGDAAGLGENNLAFRTTRKKLIIETLHLDAEGGVSERRTTPASEPIKATTDVNIPVVAVVHEPGADQQSPASIETKPKKAKKKVGFVSDRPELYDF